MIPEVNLKLSVLDPDPAPETGGLFKPPPEGGVLRLRKGDFAGREYRVALNACANPTCECCNIRVKWTLAGVEQASGPATDGGHCWLDVFEKGLVTTPELEKDLASMRLARAIEAELTEADWDQLFRWFRVAKIMEIETAETGQINIDNLPVGPRGRMVGFADIFPWGHAIDFVVHDNLWTVDEQFCVELKCTCKQTILTFLKYADPVGRQIAGPAHPPALRYDYKSGTMSTVGPWPAGLPARNEFMSALKAAVPALDLELELRHTILHTLYARRAMSQTLAQLHAVVNAGSEPTADTIARPRKVGRNDPCPCGSGKKFKHCCLGRERPKP